MRPTAGPSVGQGKGRRPYCRSPRGCASPKAGLPRVDSRKIERASSQAARLALAPLCGRAAWERAEVDLGSEDEPVGRQVSAERPVQECSGGGRPAVAGVALAATGNSEGGGLAPVPSEARRRGRGMIHPPDEAGGQAAERGLTSGFGATPRCGALWLGTPTQGTVAGWPFRPDREGSLAVQARREAPSRCIPVRAARRRADCEEIKGEG